MNPSIPVRFIQHEQSPCPELYMSVYVATKNKWEYAQFAEWLVRGSCYSALTPEEADLVIFTGGADVDPLLYGEKSHHTTRIDPVRDTDDMALYSKCAAQGIPMMGICRGAQFLAVMNGFKLYQDINNHNGPHDVWDVHNRKLLKNVSSVHHQAVIYEQDRGMEVIAHSANKANKRWKNPEEQVMGFRPDVEAYFIRDTCCLGIQGHPEYRGYPEFAAWSLKLIEDFIVCNPDIEFNSKSVRRMKDDIMKQRSDNWTWEQKKVVN